MKHTFSISLFLALTLCHAGTLRADTTITYQGRLDSGGQPHTGTVGMVFELYDQQSGGTQQGPDLNESVPVTDGLFQAELDFGQQPYEAGRWLQITVNGQLLSPRQRITGAPFALRVPEADDGPTPVRNHLVQQASGGGVFATGDLTTIRSMTFNIPDECNLTETHNVVVDISGYVENGGPSDSLVETDIELWIDGSPISAAITEIEFEAPTTFETEAFAKRRLVELSSGSHTIEVVADAESSNTDYIVDADMVVERLGWTCKG